MDDAQTKALHDFLSPSSGDPTAVLEMLAPTDGIAADVVAVDVSAAAADDAPAADKPEAEPNAAASKLRVIAKALKVIESNLTNIIKLIEEDTPAGTSMASVGTALKELSETDFSGVRPSDGRVVEGVFDGMQMVGSDGKIYAVAANYASKSKLVEGDLLKLTITPKGSFIYKQIGPIERSRLIGSLGFDPTIGEFYVTTDNRRWGVIKASVTYFKGEPGDEAIILVPKNAPSKWAAVENVIKKGYLG